MKFKYLLLLFIPGCAPLLTTPVVRDVWAPGFQYCYETGSGVKVFRDAKSSCLDYMFVVERVDRVERKYDISLDDASIFVVFNVVDCGEADKVGCAVGDLVTITDGGSYTTLTHELSHVAITRKWGDDSFNHMRLDGLDDNIPSFFDILDSSF